MENPHRHIILALVGGLTSALGATEAPPATPTPRPGTLAALASTTTLARKTCPADSAPILITDDNLAALADGAVVTMVSSPAAAFAPVTAEPLVDPEIRERWRKRVLAQGKVLARLEARRDAVESEIDRLERGRLDARTLDRIEKAETRLRAVDGEIEREQRELSRLIREARREGAQPGWFR